MGNTQEHPIIRKMEITGYPYGDDHIPVCPICGEECEIYYISKINEFLGCDNCISEENAWEWDDRHRRFD